MVNGVAEGEREDNRAMRIVIIKASGRKSPTRKRLSAGVEEGIFVANECGDPGCLALGGQAIAVREKWYCMYIKKPRKMRRMILCCLRISSREKSRRATSCWLLQYRNHARKQAVAKISMS